MYVSISNFLFFTGAFVCNISSPTSNTIEVTCKLFGNLTRVIVIYNCTSCTGRHTTYSTIKDSPVVTPDLPAGNYTVEIIAMDTDIDYADFRTVKMVTVSEYVITTTANTPTNDATDTTTNVPSTESITT